MPKTIRSYLKSVYLTLERSVLKYKKKKDILFPIRNELMFQYAYEIQKVLESDQRLRLWYCCINPDLFLNFPQVRIKYSLKTLPYKIARWIKWDLVLYPDHGSCFRADTSKIYTGHRSPWPWEAPCR